MSQTIDMLLFFLVILQSWDIDNEIQYIVLYSEIEGSNITRWLGTHSECSYFLELTCNNCLK